MFRLVALLSGFIFGVGMMVSGMTNPSKVIGFLDVFGQWDPSLAFVMGGALLVFVPGYFLAVRRQKKPLMADQFFLPKTRKIDKKLVGGALLFGAGWGLAGLCPGPAITAIGSGSLPIALFMVSMLVSIRFVAYLQRPPASSPLNA
ncbi:MULTISPECIES: YeeE/YedE family protein [unclassified Salinivibrio]|uniref:YeeE/YedE family protein n=1 Tax=unclassified Salinivibrio TaxID=2636825 RepID=UPI00128E5F10|nr:MULTISPECIES: YeeE/YedE family protein [unclassified Salinivibrio]MPS31062.1 YeeE/YedE family protein [Salinivibrio sp. VYel7]MPX89401.1 YeeE/YedE family protein [Salinivibrio sp. VYel1]MPX92463.1 YeeE/YedE family protein [Salinivibrio sp. VYel9]MPX97627.1 YeeE/YedE family protein [Salinivibrio sp. VYel6]MPX98695.1 YeeE/YedE family protein [Salinivibrio sp. VYel4]